MAVTAESLRAFLEEIAAEPVTWGRNDCTATPWRWVQRHGVTGALPAYASREAAHAIIARHGSLVATWDHYLDGQLDPRWDAPQPGDVAVIDTALHGQIGGILASGSIMVIRRDDGGFQWFGPVRRFAKVWAVPC